MGALISVIIPCHNSADTIGICLAAIGRSNYHDYEVVVVDDFSTDNTRQIVRQYPCRLVTLARHFGAGQARNAGARASRGDILFFTDADCVLQPDTLRKVAASVLAAGKNTIIGGTYTREPYDRDFFSRFQSLFIHFAETKHRQNPDYIATHALAMRAALFHQHEGFNNDAFPILEDVEYSHRLKRCGVQLRMNPDLRVQHIFNFSLTRSLQNAIRKTRFWTTYTLENHNVLADSGTASHELKFNTLAFTLTLLLVALFTLAGSYFFLAFACLVLMVNVSVNYRFLATLCKARGCIFALQASLYYVAVYPAAVTAGSILGISAFVRKRYATKEFA